ncbi:GlsB/YeaQ/YmgE family stress response membrane protein [Moraxella ovis]|uniref:GlsB/YeaQ/YmgE family stress response membrane protein n=1 Tax=Moraxella ovis TaxID=29433 RepID=UPI000D840BA6|nr:GlsB/YeaQ/YmgE family stress response membrane protein [Moraxella ovis]SPX80812.1 Transglycosylase associated protein [Moraxella ovis]STZ06067.1 Transglycosylase associated protein [Moraxella ovis]
MAWLWTIIIGFIVGLLARAIKPGANSMGWILTIILGIVGAFVGGLIASGLGIHADGGLGGLVLSVIGAIIVLFIYEFIAKRT